MKANRASKAWLIAGGALVGLLLAETAVRVLDIPPRPLAPLPIRTYRLSDNPVIGYEYIPLYKNTSPAFDRSHVGYSINAAGFRDHDYEVQKTDSTYRIIVLGDSTTAGNGIRDVGKTYSKLLEKQLNEGPGAPVRFEVMNMGVGGYQTMQEVETLRAKGLKYEPDLVLLMMCVNDFDLHFDGGVHEALSRTEHLSSSVSDTLYKALLRHSRLAFLLRYRLTLDSSRSEYDHWYANEALGGKSPVEAGLQLLSELQQEHGFETRVFILPEFSTPFDRYASGPIHEEILAAADDLEVHDLLDDFATFGAHPKTFSFDSLHMNEAGHKAVANLLLPHVRAVANKKPLRP